MERIPMIVPPTLAVVAHGALDRTVNAAPAISAHRNTSSEERFLLLDRRPELLECPAFLGPDGLLDVSRLRPEENGSDRIQVVEMPLCAIAALARPHKRFTGIAAHVAAEWLRANRPTPDAVAALLLKGERHPMVEDCCGIGRDVWPTSAARPTVDVIC